MKIALECPTTLLEEVQPLADFDFALTHLVLSDEEYAEWYKNSSRFKILDNSTNELLEPCSLEDIKRAADIIKPNLIVAPDYLGESETTILELDAAIGVFGLEKVLPVVQGSTLEEVMKCLDYIKRLGLNRVAVPYDLLSGRLATPIVMEVNRLKVVNQIIRRVPIGFDIHLLGMTTPEELPLHNKGWVKSIDTGVPIMLGAQQKGLHELSDKKEPTMNRMDSDVSWKQLSCIHRNIAMLRKVCNYD